MAQTQLGARKACAKRIGISLEEYQAHLDAGKKWCGRCTCWKPRSAFGIDTTRGDKLAVYCLIHKRVIERKSTKGRVSTFKGHKHTDAARKKMSQDRKGRKTRLGKKHTLTSRQKMSSIGRQRAKHGVASPNYKDGKVVERRGVRFSLEYKHWRYDVFTRDHFTCQHCGDNRGGNLNAHHIKSFADHPDLRFELSNGITLCEACHTKLHDKPDSTRKLAKLRRQAS